MATLTVNPVAGANSPVDGSVDREAVNESFATIRGGAGNASEVTGTTDQVRLTATSTSNQYSLLRRLIVLFDTSALTASATITSAVLSLYANVKSDTLGQSIGVVASTPASNSNLANSDYANLATTRFATDIAVSAITTSAYNDWTLNATGISAISLTGITKFGFRLSGDIDNSAPTWSSGADCYVDFMLADNGSLQPKLVINYTLPGGGSGILDLTSKTW